MKVLINTPNYTKPHLGGVANHFYGLLPYWTESVKYNIVGSRGKPGTGSRWFLYDVIKFVLRVLTFRPDAVIVNPSLAPTALRRDVFFMNIAHGMGKQVIVHFHGFNVSYAREMDGRKFVHRFKNATSFIVLNRAARDQLREWGIKQPIYLSTTKVDDRMIEGYDVNVRTGEIRNILYLGRVEEEKGIYISLDTFALVQQKHPELSFSVVGDGSALEDAKHYAKDKGIRNVEFTGALSGNALTDRFKSADLYLFTSFHEGMPTSVLEAMAFGLPVVTRPVGGLVDMFETGKMGEMVDSSEAKDFVSPIERLITHREETRQIGLYNHSYSKEHFLASKIAMKIESIIRKSINGQ